MPTPRRKEWLLVIACLAVMALWIDFSKIHRSHNSDTVVMVLASLYEWTPFFWGQDRLGMVFPLLASPWKHPLDNMLAQAAMTIFVSLSGFFLLGCYVFGRRVGIATAAIGATFLLVFLSLEQRFAYLVTIHNFATAPSIGLAGLILLDRWERGCSTLLIPCGVACIVIAHWINPPVAFLLGPLLVVRGWSFRRSATTLSEWMPMTWHARVRVITATQSNGLRSHCSAASV